MPEVLSRLYVPTAPADPEEAARLADIPGASPLPGIVNMYMPMAQPNQSPRDELVIMFDRPINFTGAYLQLMRLGRKRYRHKARQFRPVFIESVVESGHPKGFAGQWAKIPIPHGAAQITLSSPLLNQIYLPPKIKGKPKSWQDWSGTQNPLRHSDLNGQRHNKVEYKFRVARYIQNGPFEAGQESARVFSILEFIETHAGWAQIQRKYDIR